MIFLRGLRWAAGLTALVALLPLVALFTALGGRHFATRNWCALALRIFRIRVRVRGEIPAPGSFVAMNHLSYFDPIVAGSVLPGRFIAKEEVSRWLLAGLVARTGRVVFIDRTSARRSQQTLMKVAGILAGKESALVFAEGGIRGDGDKIAPFLPMLFEAVVRAQGPVVPLAIKYLRPADPSVWRWGEGSMFEHLLKKVLGAGEILVELRFGDPIVPGREQNRKELAFLAHKAVSELYSGAAE
ncbi:1-acyl-sn-glycerol-3-phosphate acyltransferase [bacterium]|nr:MAG: 1-acyl-sn-glycerol-3-phosphate acyltransferase [bacterium]